MSSIDIAIKLAKTFEGCKLKSYWDDAGDVWTCGYGVTSDDVTSNTVWTQEEAELRLSECINSAAKALVAISPSILNESVERQGALIDFIYNLGQGSYKGSTLRKCVDAGDWTKAINEIKRWDHAGGKILPGLTRRRLAESKLLVS